MGSIYLEIEDDSRVGHYDRVDYGDLRILGYLRDGSNPDKLFFGNHVSIQMDATCEPQDVTAWTRRQMFDYGASQPATHKMRLSSILVLQNPDDCDRTNTVATRLAGKSPDDPIRGPAVLVFE